MKPSHASIRTDDGYNATTDHDGNKDTTVTSSQRQRALSRSATTPSSNLKRMLKKRKLSLPVVHQQENQNETDGVGSAVILEKQQQPNNRKKQKSRYHFQNNKDETHNNGSSSISKNDVVMTSNIITNTIMDDNNNDDIFCSDAGGDNHNNEKEAGTFNLNHCKDSSSVVVVRRVSTSPSHTTSTKRKAKKQKVMIGDEPSRDTSSKNSTRKSSNIKNCTPEVCTTIPNSSRSSRSSSSSASTSGSTAITTLRSQKSGNGIQKQQCSYHHQEKELWICSACTFHNQMKKRKCEICKTIRSKSFVETTTTTTLVGVSEKEKESTVITTIPTSTNKMKNITKTNNQEIMIPRSTRSSESSQHHSSLRHVEVKESIEKGSSVAQPKLPENATTPIISTTKEVKKKQFVSEVKRCGNEKHDEKIEKVSTTPPHTTITTAQQSNGSTSNKFNDGMVTTEKGTMKNPPQTNTTQQKNGTCNKKFDDVITAEKVKIPSHTSTAQQKIHNKNPTMVTQTNDQKVHLYYAEATINNNDTSKGINPIMDFEKVNNSKSLPLNSEKEDNVHNKKMKESLQQKVGEYDDHNNDHNIPILLGGIVQNLEIKTENVTMEMIKMKNMLQEQNTLLHQLQQTIVQQQLDFVQLLKNQNDHLNSTMSHHIKQSLISRRSDEEHLPVPTNDLDSSRCDDSTPKKHTNRYSKPSLDSKQKSTIPSKNLSPRSIDDQMTNHRKQSDPTTHTNDFYNTDTFDNEEYSNHKTRREIPIGNLIDTINPSKSTNNNDPTSEEWNLPTPTLFNSSYSPNYSETIRRKKSPTTTKHVASDNDVNNEADSKRFSLEETSVPTTSLIEEFQLKNTSRPIDTGASKLTFVKNKSPFQPLSNNSSQTLDDDEIMKVMNISRVAPNEIKRTPAKEGKAYMSLKYLQEKKEQLNILKERNSTSGPSDTKVDSETSLKLIEPIQACNKNIEKRNTKQSLCADENINMKHVSRKKQSPTKEQQSEEVLLTVNTNKEAPIEQPKRQQGGWMTNNGPRQFMQELRATAMARLTDTSMCASTGTTTPTKTGKVENVATEDHTATRFVRKIPQKVNENDPKHAYIETVRCKAHREKLSCHDCVSCRRFYTFLHKTGHTLNPDQMQHVLPTTTNNNNNISNEDNKNKEEVRVDALQFSRHRAQYPLSETPDNFWEIDFIDEMNTASSKTS